ncbi:MAG: hypothetical protein ACI8SR_003483 [Oceanicoccus sp.]|jgi:hypothetical protein
MFCVHRLSCFRLQAASYSNVFKLNRRHKNVWIPSLLQVTFAMIRWFCANVFGVFSGKAYFPAP